MNSYTIFALGLFVGIFAGFFIIGILESLKAGVVRNNITYCTPKITYRPDDFEPVRALRCIDGGKKRG